jgi:hypothetical protein
MKTLLGIKKAAKVITKLKTPKGTIIEDQGDVEKTLAENYIQKLGGSNPIKIKFSAHPPNNFIPDQPLFL